jgi:tritrans,polycis-undecaprenyl-diphosphate synthase [geranylgeranyl-diphosphate specific]
MIKMAGKNALNEDSSELSPVPRHIGIIMDGNRRFAKRLMMKPWKGHEWGAEKVENLLRWAGDMGVKELTLYTFSLENFNRPKQEFDYLMDLFEKELQKVMNDKEIMEKGLRINFIGRIYLFPKTLQETMKKLQEKTGKNNNMTVNFAMAYSGRAEVVDAARKIAEEVKKGKMSVEDINEETFSRNLYNSSEPDLIIRTSESRLSGFLPYQSVYSEIIFLKDKLWPEFSREDFLECVKEYQQRKRRFGQ